MVNTPIVPVIDQIGQDVQVGDWIAYGVGRGEISTALVIGFKPSSTYVWDPQTRQRSQVPAVKMQIKSPMNERASLIEAYRKEFIKIPPREEGAEMGRRNEN